MMMEGLRNALADVNRARQTYLTACSAVLESLREVEPELAADISTMWPDDGVAAEWVCSPLDNDLSPIEMVLAGRTDLIQSILLRAGHGFCA